MDLIEKLIKMRSDVFSVLYLKGYFNRKESSHTHFDIFLYTGSLRYPSAIRMLKQVKSLQRQT